VASAHCQIPIQYKLQPENIAKNEKIRVGGEAEIYKGKYQGQVVAIRTPHKIDIDWNRLQRVRICHKFEFGSPLITLLLALLPRDNHPLPNTTQEPCFAHWCLCWIQGRSDDDDNALDGEWLCRGIFEKEPRPIIIYSNCSFSSLTPGW
jgi:hypothetical protein